MRLAPTATIATLALTLTGAANAGDNNRWGPYWKQDAGANNGPVQQAPVFPIEGGKPAEAAGTERAVRPQGNIKILGTANPALPVITMRKALELARKACEQEFGDTMTIPLEAPAGIDQTETEFDITFLKTLDPTAKAGGFYAKVQVAVHGGTILRIEEEPEPAEEPAEGN